MRLTLAAVLAFGVGAGAQAQVITIATNPQGSLYYTAASGIVKVAHDKLELQLRVQPMAGTSTALPMLNRGEVEFSFANVDEAEVGYRGVEEFAGKPNPNMRLVTVIFALPVAMLVAADSPYKGMPDLKGARVPTEFTSQSTIRKLLDGLLANGELRVADIRPVPVTNAFQGTEMVGAGRADAALTAPGTAQAQKVHAELSSRGGARFLPIDDSPAAIASMRKSMNSYPLTIQPARHLPGIVGPTVVMGFSSFMVTHDKVPEELVYKFTKMLHDSRADIVAVVPQMERFDSAKMSEQHVVPYHPGAIKFYSEVGQWPPKS